MQIHRLERIQLIQRPLSEVFAFFSDAGNLQAITPSFLGFRILTPLPIEMRAGARIDYALSLAGIPLRWQTRITEWEPEARFVDEQERGPYTLWRHLHEFESLGDATRIRDVVDYALPFGLLGALAHALWVRRTLDAIFDYRERAVAERLEGARAREGPIAGSPPAMATHPEQP